MRVALVGPFGLQPQGTMAVRALPLAHALARRGHTPLVVLAPWSYPADSGREWDDGPVRIENVPISPRAAIPFHLVSRVRAFRPDVVHIFKPKSYAGLVQWFLWQLERTGGFRGRIVLDEDDWEGAGGWNDLEPRPWPYPQFFAWQERWGLTHAHLVTVASRALETIALSAGVPRARLLYLPNGANALAPASGTPASIRAGLGFGDAPVLLLYTRFFEYDLERFGRVLSRIFARRPDARLLLVGKGLHGEETRFFEIAAAQGWRDRVVDAGWTEPARLRSLFAASDLALYPFDDTLVNRTKAIVKLMDLLTAGVPVVAEAVGQIREYIENGETGMLVAPGDEEAFARSVLDLLHDPDRRLRLGACAAVAMSRDYNWDTLAARLEGRYLASPYQGEGRV